MGAFIYGPTRSIRYKVYLILFQTLNNRQQNVVNSILVGLMKRNKRQLYWGKKRGVGETRKRFGRQMEISPQKALRYMKT